MSTSFSAWPLAPPSVPPDQTATSAIPVRYEDIAQDGRVRVTALPHAFGDAVWMPLLAHHPLAGLARDQGILPILSKLVIAGDEGVVPVTRPLEARGAFALARTPDEESPRVVLNIWVAIEGRAGRTHGPPPARPGAPVPVGRVYGEHVFTRPFAPPGSRRVSRLEADGVPEVPERTHVYRPANAVLSLPDGARPLDADLEPDPAPVVFGLTHTDSNQHVNSLVYPRLFEEALVRRLADHGRRTDVLVRRVELGFRKPCFAGDRMRLRLRAYERDGGLGAIGVFEPARGERPTPHCYVRAEVG